MSVTIDLDPEIEAGFAADAAALGVSLPEYLRQVLKDQTAPATGKPVSPGERAAFWREAAKDLPDSRRYSTKRSVGRASMLVAAR